MLNCNTREIIGRRKRAIQRARHCWGREATGLCAPGKASSKEPAGRPSRLRASRRYGRAAKPSGDVQSGAMFAVREKKEQGGDVARFWSGWEHGGARSEQTLGMRDLLRGA